MTEFTLNLNQRIITQLKALSDFLSKPLELTIIPTKPEYEDNNELTDIFNKVEKILNDSLKHKQNFNKIILYEQHNKDMTIYQFTLQRHYPLIIWIFINDKQIVFELETNTYIVNFDEIDKVSTFINNLHIDMTNTTNHIKNYELEKDLLDFYDKHCITFQ